MNNLLLLKGQLVSRKNPSRGGLSYKKTIKVKAGFVKKLWQQLEGVRELFAADHRIGGALVDVHYTRVVPKSSRISTLLGDDDNHNPTATIRGARFESIPGRDGSHEFAHVFTHFVSIASLDRSIATLKMVEGVLRTQFEGEATFERLEAAKKSGFPIGVAGQKTLFQYTVRDLDSIRMFSATHATFPEDKTAVVSLYNTGIETKELLARFGVRVSAEDILDGNVVQLRGADIRKLNSVAPYLIAMGSTDLTKIPPVEYERGEGPSDVLEFPRPNGEPVIGVLDTAFDEDVYFKEWVKYEDRRQLPQGIGGGIREKIHGTSVSSIIVDGPRLNPRLDDGCGRFQVRHFGITTFGPMSSFAILKRIRKVVEDNPDIRIWNLSIGSGLEVSDNSISPVGAELDRIQKAYGVIFVVAGTNVPEDESGRTDMKVGAPADSLNSVVVNAVDFEDKPASYTRIGPVLSFFYKPDICYYGGDGNNSRTGMCVHTGIGIRYTSGTSFAAPWVARKLAYLINVMGLSVEVAKGLLIDSAARWDSHAHDDLIRRGYGIVPVRIDDVLKSEDGEIKFVITGTADEYETHSYEIPVPTANGAHPYFAKATLVYFPDCDRNQGVDYTITEMDIYFGRAALKDGRPRILSINRNTQDNDEDYGPLEESARKLFRKWDNVKHIADELNPRARPKAATLSQMWGLKILTKDRRSIGARDKIRFGVIITLRAMDGANRYNDFIDMCQMHHWIVHPLVPVVRAEAYQQATGEVALS